jgi:hypothetical protein
MVTNTKHPGVQLREICGQVREVRQTRTARIYSRPILSIELDWLLMDPAEHDCPDELHVVDERLGADGSNLASARREQPVSMHGCRQC